MARYTYRLTSVRLEDASGTGFTLSPTDGDFSAGAENDSNRERARVLDRGAFDGIVEGDDLEQELSITLQMRNETLTSAAAARVTDFIKRQNFFSSLVSVDDTVWAFKCIVTFNDGTTSTTKTYPHCTGTISLSEGNPVNTFSISLTNYEAPEEA